MKRDVDIAVVGGGMVGACLASLLAQLRLVPAQRIALIEARMPSAPTLNDDIELRVSALSRASERILTACGAWEQISASRTCAYEHMRVWDEAAKSDGPGAIEFDCARIGQPNLGYIIENRRIQWALLERARAIGVRIVQASVRGVEAQTDVMRVELENGQQLGTALLVAADGAESPTRRLLGVETRQSSHEQRAVVSNVLTAEPHELTAWQRFLRTGPVAFLPLYDGRVSVVWSTTPEESARLLALPPAEFCEALGQATDFVLGRIEQCGPRADFPLQSSHALNYVGPRFALIGDAAHAVHPLAGQGVNLGFLDCGALAEVLEDARAEGEDFGEFRVLRRYERWRKGENLLMLSALDGLNRLFSNESSALGGLRRFGLTLVNRIEPAKTLFMRRALGLTGDLPRIATMDA